MVGSQVSDSGQLKETFVPVTQQEVNNETN